MGRVDQRRWFWHYAVPLAWSAYLLWPAPLTPLSAAALFAVWWIWSVGRQLPGARWVVLLLLVKTVSGPLLVPRGMHASYFTNGVWQGPPERGLGGAWPGETRIDSSLAFGDGSPDFPLYFLNDTRFNRPGATREPLSVEWTGYRLASTEADLNLFLSGRGVSAQAHIDGFPVVALGPEENESIGQVGVRPGWYRLTVTFSSPSGVPETFQAGVVDPSDGRTRPFSASDVFQRPVSPARMRADRWLGRLASMCDLIALAMLAVVGATALRDTLTPSSGPRPRWRERAIRVLPLLAFAEALYFAHPAWNRLDLLGWGTDRLAYESAARDILFHGPLMSLGAPLGQGAAFYYQPLYSYFLALVHLVAGEGLWGVYLCQRLGLAATAYALWSIAGVLFGAPAALAAVVLALWFAFVRLHDFSAALYTESLFIPLLCLCTLWLCREVARPGTGRLAVGALVGGLSTLSRSTVLAAWPPAALVLILAYQRARQPLRRLMVFCVLIASVVGLATVRNGIVSGRFVLISSSLPDNLYMGNPSAPLPEPHDGRHAWMEWVARDARTRAVVEYAYHAPGEFTTGLLRKAAYALGLESAFAVTRPAAFASTIGIHPTLPWIWMTALVGGVMLLVGGRPLTLAQLVPALVALSHFAAIVAIFPYSERLVLPFYALLVPYAAIPFGALLSRVGGRRV